MKTGQDKRRECSNLNLICEIYVLGHILKSQHIHFLVHDHSSWSTFGIHLVRGPKAL